MKTTWLKRLSLRLHRERCPEFGNEIHRTYCDVCGYDLIRQVRDHAPIRPS